MTNQISLPEVDLDSAYGLLAWDSSPMLSEAESIGAMRLLVSSYVARLAAIWGNAARWVRMFNLPLDTVPDNGLAPCRPTPVSVLAIHRIRYGSPLVVVISVSPIALGMFVFLLKKGSDIIRSYSTLPSDIEADRAENRARVERARAEIAKAQVRTLEAECEAELVTAVRAQAAQRGLDLSPAQIQSLLRRRFTGPYRGHRRHLQLRRPQNPCHL